MVLGMAGGRAGRQVAQGHGAGGPAQVGPCPQGPRTEASGLYCRRADLQVLLRMAGHRGGRRHGGRGRTGEALATGPWQGCDCRASGFLPGSRRAVYCTLTATVTWKLGP